MKVFADFHHIGLYYSLQLLFENRLGWELYRPIGEEWATSGYWKIAEPYNNNPQTIKQFLGVDDRDWDAYSSLNGDYVLDDGIYNVYNHTSKSHEKAVTLQKFKEMEFDIVISSYQPHDESFARLIKDFQPKAKHIAQMGNIFQTTNVKNVMCSTLPYPTTPDTNVVFYHQEFDLNTFKYKDPTISNCITNFVNLDPAKETFDMFKSQMPEYQFKSYGMGCPDGIISGEQKIADIMSDSTFGFHVKPDGDGFGHLIHNWYACGRPVITNGSDYYDKLAGLLLEDGVTCIDLQKRSTQANIDYIKKMSEPENHIKLCQNAFNRFKEIVNFDEEEIAIREFLDNLV